MHAGAAVLVFALGAGVAGANSAHAANGAGDPEAGPQPASQPVPQLASQFDLTQLHAKYKFVGGAKQSDAIALAVDAGIKGLPAGLYELARRRITKTQRAWPTMQIDIEGLDVRVQRGPEKAAHTTAKKTKFVLINRLGERYVYRQKVSGKSLTQVVTGLGNKTKISYRFNKDGSRLIFKMTIDADLLPRPISYSLTYARVD